MKITRINCGVFEVTDLDNTTVFFVGTIEACEKFVRRYGD